jgi:hypothetical protein
MADPGIFCLEGEWDHETVTSRLSVRPLLELVEMLDVSGGTFHRDVATRGELTYYLERWTADDETDFPVAYLAFHGSPGCLALARESVTLTELAEMLGTGAAGRVIHFGTCGTLKVASDDLSAFCRRTGVRGVTGYTGYVDWAESAGFDILLLRELLGSANLKPMFKRLEKRYPGFVEDLGLRVATPNWALPADA